MLNKNMRNNYQPFNVTLQRIIKNMEKGLQQILNVESKII